MSNLERFKALKSPEEIIFTISHDEMIGYGVLSGDFNKIHTDHLYAVANGFEGLVVYGGLIISKVSQLIGMHMPSTKLIWAALNIKFHSPLYLGEAATLSYCIDNISVSTGAVECKFKISVATKLVASGMFDVILFRT